jgi:hypothetical protein
MFPSSTQIWKVLPYRGQLLETLPGIVYSTFVCLLASSSSGRDEGHKHSFHSPKHKNSSEQEDRDIRRRRGDGGWLGDAGSLNRRRGCSEGGGGGRRGNFKHAGQRVLILSAAFFVVQKPCRELKSRERWQTFFVRKQHAGIQF